MLWEGIEDGALEFVVLGLLDSVGGGEIVGPVETG
jgi:hypothetical protein